LDKLCIVSLRAVLHPPTVVPGMHRRHIRTITIVYCCADRPVLVHQAEGYEGGAEGCEHDDSFPDKDIVVSLWWHWGTRSRVWAQRRVTRPVRGMPQATTVLVHRSNAAFPLYILDDRIVESTECDRGQWGLAAALGESSSPMCGENVMTSIRRAKHPQPKAKNPRRSDRSWSSSSSASDHQHYSSRFHSLTLELASSTCT
jgi:hypothetical protein